MSVLDELVAEYSDILVLGISYSICVDNRPRIVVAGTFTAGDGCCWPLKIWSIILCTEPILICSAPILEPKVALPNAPPMAGSNANTPAVPNPGITPVGANRPTNLSARCSPEP